MTETERQQLHEALFSRLLHEVKAGSLGDAQKALDMMEGEAASQTLAELIGCDN